MTPSISIVLPDVAIAIPVMIFSLANVTLVA